MILFRELGRFLVREPFLETLVLGGGLLRSLSTQGRYAEKISNLMAGNLQGGPFRLSTAWRYRVE